MGEGVRRRVVDFVHLGHGHVGEPSLLLNQVVELGIVLAANFFGVGHTQGNLVAEPVRAEVQRQREEQGDDDASLTADCAANKQQHSGQYHQQEEGFESVHIRVSSGAGVIRRVHVVIVPLRV